MKKKNNKNIWSWFWIISLWLSGFYMFAFAPLNNSFQLGLYIGQGIVFIMWAIVETIKKLLIKRV